MISSQLRTFIYVLLAFLVILDIVLSVVALCFPDTWFMTFHGVPYDNLDAQGLLKRTGAIWVAFTLLQLIAFFRWEKEPWWLVLIAGVRWTELFSDWTYLYVADTITTMGKIGLLIAPPGNLVFGWILIWVYKKIGKQ
ncbi:MAG TPA: hypothetical protein VJT15_06220 [Pyrinomonadaceae bacterium]|nr:hypothetical protein [Pyrinomonadaceae bacterium]